MGSEHYIAGFQKGKNLESLSRTLVGRVVTSYLFLWNGLSEHYIAGFQKGKNLESLSRTLVGRVVDIFI
jgi:hypothetical protein